ncbi:hypothetical protein BGZ76_008287 [Entomortierella beljakovae]|nr:hypothetical protein BGZ76_008287 [Entomortierella beljakovae]
MEDHNHRYISGWQDVKVDIGVAPVSNDSVNDSDDFGDGETEMNNVMGGYDYVPENMMDLGNHIDESHESWIDDIGVEAGAGTMLALRT